MEVRTIKDSPKKISFVNKITFILLGVFTTSIIFGLSTNLLPTKSGIYMGLGITIGLCMFGLYKTKKGSALRLVIWGILGTTVIGTIGFFVLLKILTSFEF